MQESKYFCCGGFGYIACNCRNERNIKENRRGEVGRPEQQPSSNIFKVLTSSVIMTGMSDKEKEKKAVEKSYG